MQSLQQLMLFANIGLLLFGLGILGYGLYSRFGDNFFISILQYGHLWDCSNLMLITAGLLAGGSILRLLQPVASVFKNKRVVLTVVITTVTAFVSGLALIIFVFGVYYEPKDYAAKSVTEQIKHNYGQRPNEKKNSDVTPATNAIDKIQEKYKCCGVKGYTDWQGSEWSLQTGLRVPKSCCNTTDYKECQDKKGNVSTIFQQNCAKELEDWAEKNIPLIGGLGCVQFVFVIGAGILTAITTKQTAILLLNCRYLKVRIFPAMRMMTVLALSADAMLVTFGLGILGYALYSRFADEFFISILRQGKPWDCDNLLLIAGGLIATGAISRFYVAYKSDKRGLISSIISTFVAFISALVLIILVFRFYYEPGKYAVDAVTEQIKENYGETTDSEHGSTISPATNAIDEIQEKYKCCGAKGYADWLESEWSSVWSLRVPKSCCNTSNYKACQDRNGNISTIFQQSCSSKLEDWAVKNIPILGGLGCATFACAVRPAAHFNKFIDGCKCTNGCHHKATLLQ